MAERSQRQRLLDWWLDHFLWVIIAMIALGCLLIGFKNGWS